MKLKKLLAVVLAFAMVLSTMSTVVLAEDTADHGKVISSVEAVEINGENGLTFAVKFDVEEKIADYNLWKMDVFLTTNKNLTLDATDSSSEGYLSVLLPSLSAFGNNGSWRDLPASSALMPGNYLVGGAEVEADKPFKVMEYFFNDAGLGETPTPNYRDLEDGLSCGLKLNQNFLNDNEDFYGEISLVIYQIEEFEEKNHITLASYSFGEKPADPVAKVGDAYYSDIQEAIVAAAPAGTVELISDVVVDEWNMISETLSMSDDSLITIDKIDGLTIDGNGYTLTVNDIESAGNGGYLFYDATKLNIKDLTIKVADGLKGGIGLSSGVISGVTFEGGWYSVLPGKADTGVTITNCTFNNVEKNAIYFDSEKDNLVVENNTFAVADGAYAIIMYGGVDFIGNTVANGKVNLANSASGEVSGNDFGGNRFKVYNASTATIENNKIIVLEFNDESEVKASFGNNALSEDAKVALKGAGVAVNPVPVVALNNVDYPDFQSAYEAAKAGDTITLRSDIIITKPIEITKNIILDLNGKTIEGLDTATASFGLIKVNVGCELTINDSVGSGKIILKATNNREWNAYSSVVSNQCGKLTVNGGTIEHLGGTDMAYGIDNLTNGKGTYAETVINGGTVKSTYRAIRQFLNGAEANNILTINGGVIEGTNKAVWMQDPSTGANSGALTIGEKATVNGNVYLTVTAGSTQWPVKIDIAKSAVNGEVLTTNVPDGYELVESNGSFSVKAPVVITELEGEGTEEAPYLIKNIKELVFFRDSVNAGETKYNAEGVYVALAGNINMAGYDWNVNIGDDASASFDGIFDGKDYKLSNLTATETAQKSDGYVCTGLFGALSGNAVIKNLTIENVTINTGDFTGNNAGIVVGFIWNGNVKIENVKVVGDIKVDAKGIYGVGAIAGYDYYGNTVINNCTVEANDGSYIKASSGVAGIIGYAGAADVLNSSVANIDLEAKGIVGGIAGVVYGGAKVANCAVKNVNLAATKDVWVNSTAIAIGTLSARENIEVSGVTYEDVNTDKLIGSAYAEQPTEVVPAIIAKVGDTYYTSLDEALTAASALTGDVTVELYNKGVLNKPLTGSYSAITFEGKAEAAEIYMDIQGYITASGKDVEFKNLNLSKAAGGFVTNAGFMNVAFGIYDAKSVAYDNCVFKNGAYSSGKTSFEDCTFYRSHDRYGLWVYGDTECIVDGCTFDDIRGIKVYHEGKEKTADLTVKNTAFTNKVNNKPAIVLTNGKSVTLENNTYSSTGVFELDLDGNPNGTIVTSDIDPTCVNDNGACGVLVDGKIYTTVADAAAVAEDGDTVTLLHDSKETITLADGIILDRNGFTAAGVTASKSVVIEVETYEELIAALNLPNAEVKMMNNITATATQGSGYGKAGIVVGKGDILDGNGKTLTINGANATWDCVIAMTGGTVKNLTVAGAMRGIFMPGANEDVVIDGVVIKDVIYTFNSDAGSKDYAVTIKNTTLNGWTSFSNAHEAVTFENCTFGEGNGYAYCRPYQGTTFNNCAFAEGYEFDAQRVADSKPLAFNNSTYAGEPLSEENGAMFYIGGNVIIDGEAVEFIDPSMVAEINGNTFATLTEAIAAAVSGDTITLLADINENVSINNSITLDGNGKTYTGTMTLSSGITATVQNVNFVNGGIDKSTKSDKGNYTIKNCTFDGEGKYAYPLRFKGAKDVTVENCTVKDYVYSFLYVTSGTNKVSVKNVTVEDCPNYAVYFASGVNSATFENLTVKNSNNGFILNNTANRAFTIKDCKMENVGTAINHSSGTNTITCTVLGANDFGTAASSEYAKYVLTEGATLTAKNGFDVTTNVEGSFVQYAGGTYYVIAKREITVSANKDKVVAGEEFTVTVELAKGKDIVNAEWILTYKPELFELKDSADQTGTIKEALYKTYEGEIFAEGEALKTYTFVAKAVEAETTGHFALSETTASTFAESIDKIYVAAVKNDPVPVTIIMKDYNVSATLNGEDVDLTVTEPVAETTYTGEAQKFVVETKLPEDVDYEITYTVDGEAVAEPAFTNAGTYEVVYTITTKKGYANKTGKVTITVKHPDFVVETAKWTNMGKKLVLVYTNQDKLYFTYDNNLMIDVTAKEYKYEGTPYDHVFAFVTDELANDVVDSYKANIKYIGKANDLFILADGNENADINFSDDLNVQDITTEFGIVNLHSEIYGDVKYQKHLLKGDTNGDKVVNGIDTGFVVSEVKKELGIK